MFSKWLRSLALLILLYLYVKAESDLKDNGFVFTAPKTLWAGRRETACLSLHGHNSTGRANITVNIETTGPKHDSSTTKKVFDADNLGCFEIRVPNTTDHTAKLHLQVKFSDQSNYSINSVDVVTIFPSNGVTFVLTDKETYTPGDRVKIRILMLSQELNVPRNLNIPIVKIRNPIGIAIGQWENVMTELGLVQLEHQLSQDTILGTWTIELAHISKIFEVKQYVLPRYVVYIENLKPVYHKAEYFNFTVCAKYSYGAYVKGTAHVKLELGYNGPTVNQIKGLVNGCSDFEFKNEDISMSSLNHHTGIHLTSTVTEQGTDQSETMSSEVKIVGQKYSLEFDTSKYFQPGLPYSGQVHAKDNYGDLYNKTMLICYNFGIRQSWNLTEETCSYYKMKDNVTVQFTILPFEDDINTIRITAQIANDKENEKQHMIIAFITQWYSPSNSFIQISQHTTAAIKCKSWQQFHILYTVDNTVNNHTIMFNYLIMSKGHLLKHGKVAHIQNMIQLSELEYKNILGDVTLPTKLPIDKFILTLKIHQKMFAEAQILVYYIRTDGEIVGSSKSIDVEPCLANKVDANWLSNQKYPGESATFKVKAAAGSLCAIGAVDKKTEFINPSFHLNINTLLELAKKPENKRRSTVKCRIETDISESIPYWDLKRRKRYLNGLLPQFYDTSQVFNEFGVLIMTDLKMGLSPCMGYHGRQTMEFQSHDLENERMYRVLDGFRDSPAPYQTQPSDKGAAVRSYFPETWLWELTRIGRSGESILKRNLPHSITEWVGNTVCISPSAGVGISKISHITAFQPFFVDLITPYSIKIREILHLKVLVFNYLNHSLPVRITLGEQQGIRLESPLEEGSVTACINPNDSTYKVFRVSAYSLDKVNVTVTAEVDSSYPGECGPEVLLNRRDVIVKSILVQPEGFPFESIKSSFVCIEENTNKSLGLKWDLEQPYDAVKNSTKFKILMDNDLLGLAIENLGSLLNIPTGCGEQIMATLAPNLYVLRYLNSTKNLPEDIHIKAINNIKIGYERILQYKHFDGSFSAFGEKYGEGSIFLTAFVVRTLSHAAKYVYIEKSIIRNAAAWILEKQLENGCFPSTSHVFQPSLSENGNENSGLTAYVLISLIESNIPVSETVSKNAKFCLRGYNTLDKYTLAITTYALTLLDWKNEIDRSIDRLFELASRKNNLIWWDNPESTSSSIEMTSYVIMSLLLTNSSENIALATSAVRWLTTQRNGYGGFQTTQDTVVALDALTKYSVMVKGQETNITLSLTTASKQYTYQIRDKDTFKTKQLTIKNFSDSIVFNLTGKGCIILQSILQYNLPHMISSEAFKLAVLLSPVSTIDKCSIAEVSACFSYTVPNKHANMAVLEVTLPSGYKADRTSLHDLIKKSNVKRFEEIGEKVILYFTDLNNEKICAPFLINENAIVESRSPAIVQLYDYYNPELSVSTSYEMSKCISENVDLAGYQQDALIYDSELNDIDYHRKFDTSPKTGLNPNFVDKDIILDHPEGIEGPKHVYVVPPPGMKLKLP